MSNQITNKQLIILITFYIFGSIFFSMPRVLVHTSNHTGWLSILAAMLFFCGYAWLVMAVIGRMKQSDDQLIVYASQCLGLVGGRIFSAVFILIPLLLFMSFTNRLVADLFTLLILPETPREIIIICIIFMQYHMLGGGITTVARWSQLIMPFSAVMITVLYALSLSNSQLTRLQPVLDSTFFGFFDGTLFIFGGFAEAAVLFFIYRHVRNRQALFQSLLYVNGWVSVLFLSTFLVVLSTMSTSHIKRTIFPVIELIRDITLFDSIEHLEFIFLVVWMFIILSKAALSMYASCEGWRQWFDLKNYNSIRIPVCVIIYFCSLMPQNLLDAVIEVESFKAIVFPVYSILMLVCLWGMSLLRREGKLR
ncbi:endospore germination permease [Paenibacillus sp. HB172176]|uniref:GerAB/ArcD/ProY family transporter n=1 Tax=Paenibacillus sp. HB172176 TaxID=2493690 RepID=UPI00143A3776|nr:endospore germination permease [Paenibacillus sp. HB172176]